MDNHPIPQDVTSFQFRLIGNMTVKQFAYVAVGCVSAVILYYIPIGGFFTLIKVLFIPLFILGGILTAFVPIEGRPIDVMVTQFIKALFSPTQFIYQKSGGQLMLSTVHIQPKIAAQAADTNGTAARPTPHGSAQANADRQKQLAAYLASLEQNQPKEEKEADRLSALFQPTSAAPAPSPSPLPEAPAVMGTGTVTEPTATPNTEAAPADITTQIERDTVKIAEDEKMIEQVNAELTQAIAAEQAAGSQPTTSQAAHANVLDLEKKLQQIMAEKQLLEQELNALKASSPTPKVVTAPQIPSVPVPPAPVTPPPPAPSAPQMQSPEPNPQQQPVSKGNFPSLPDVPNILLGIVKDSSGNVLPHILVDVKDADDNPVRAFKTNQLGQFMSATPLKEGTYTLTFEDAKNQYQFDTVTVTVDNRILAPVEVSAHDLREELRKSLFA